MRMILNNQINDVYVLRSLVITDISVIYCIIVKINLFTFTQIMLAESISVVFLHITNSRKQKLNDSDCCLVNIWRYITYMAKKFKLFGAKK